MIKKFVIELDDQSATDKELIAYIKISIRNWRGSLHPSDSVQDFNLISVKKVILNQTNDCR